MSSCWGLLHLLLPLGVVLSHLGNTFNWHSLNRVGLQPPRKVHGPRHWQSLAVLGLPAIMVGCCSRQRVSAALPCAAPEPDGLKHEQPKPTQEVTSVSPDL